MNNFWTPHFPQTGYLVCKATDSPTTAMQRADKEKVTVTLVFRDGRKPIAIELKNFEMREHRGVVEVGSGLQKSDTTFLLMGGAHHMQ